MTTRIRFEELVVQTTTERATYRFEDPITPVIGPVGSGKTSLLELLKYAIGGAAALSGAVSRSVIYVTVKVAFADQTLIFARSIGATTVDVHDAAGTLLETIGARSSRHHRLASDYLLEAAGLPALTVTKRGGAAGRVERLSFFDVFRYCYLSQTEIDRSVVRHDDNIYERRRKATFEMLFGLSDIETSAADRVVAELSEALGAARSNEAAVKRFLEQTAEASETSLTEERVRVIATIGSMRDQLEMVRSDMRQVTVDETARQRAVTNLARQVREANERVAVLQDQLSDHATSVAQYELQLERVGRTVSARQLLDRVEFSRCPRCMQSVSGRVLELDHCLLCTQPEPAARTIDDFSTGDLNGQLGFGMLAVNDERRRIEALRDEVIGLADLDRADLENALSVLRGLDVALRETLADLDRRTEQYVSPRFEAISELSSVLASSEGRLAAIDSALILWERHRDLVGTVTRLTNQLEEARASAARAHSALDSRRAIVIELSEAFDDQIKRLQPPWYDGAYIDLKTYLPVLNGATFESLSGGEKTMVNVAYHLALLTVALANRDTAFPALLLIDTPRKNLGAGYDQSYAQRIYRQIRALSDTYGGTFQLVIADNDPPSIDLGRARPIRLDYERPLVPGVDHPGPSVEPVAGGTEDD